MAAGPVGKQRVIIREKLRSDREHAVHDEGSREYVNGIMHVREKHGGAEDDSSDDEKAAPELFIPKNERQEIRKRGVAREEKIPLEREEVIKSEAGIGSAWHDAAGINPFAGQVHEERAEDDEQRDCFYPKQQVVRAGNKEKTGTNPKKNGDAHDKEPKIDDGKIVQEKVAFGRRQEHVVRGIVPGAYLDENRDCHEEKSEV